MNSRPKKDQGSIAILTALSLTVILGFCALATDMALLYAKKSHLQNSVDAVALAAVQELSKDGGQASAHLQAIEYASNNNIALSSLQISNSEVSVHSQKEVPTLLAKVLGITSETVSADATARLFSPQSVVGAVPLSIKMQNFVFGQQYQLKSAPSDGESGWYGPIRLDGQGANVYQDELTNGCNKPLEVGQIVEVEHGNMSGPTQKGLEDRLALDTRVPTNTFESHDNDAPEIVYIPVVEVISLLENSIHEVKILGFAAFFVEDVTGTGNDSIITGRFLKTIVSHGSESSSLNDLINAEQSGSLKNYGLLTPKLIID